MRIWNKVWSAVFVPVPANYAEVFLNSIMLENLQRLILGGVLLSLIEAAILVSGQFSAGGFYFQVSVIVFNILLIPVILYLRRRRVRNRKARFLVYLSVAFYLIWSCFYFWNVRSSRPFYDVGIPVYLLMVFGVAVFLYMEPVWSAGLFLSSFGLFIYMLLLASIDERAFWGNTWNALALNLFAWMISRLLFASHMRTFIARDEADQARAKSDALLLNILPQKIVADLKDTGKTTPEMFENVTVLFSDVVNFTSVSSQLDPEVLIGELNELFTAFDEILDHHQGERIKTMGDAYMCVCGMPRPQPEHATHILKVALDMLEFVNRRNAVRTQEWKIRIGVHSGPVIGGVVGTHKYIYDVFGDTINIASRMEQHSLPMKINVSERTYQLTNGSFLFSEREPVDVKGIGSMRMYFLEGLA